MEQQDIYKIALDSLSAHIAILDESGIIIATNRSWQQFARENDLADRLDCVGLNYLSLCDLASGPSSLEAGQVADGIRKVMAGEIEEYLTQYPCHSKQEKRWFTCRVVRYRWPGAARVIVTHENITPIIEVQKALERKDKELEETNIALKVLLKEREQDRRELEETVLINVREQILPHVEKLSAALFKKPEQLVVETIHFQLQEIISPFLSRLASLHRLLTAQEMNVASLVREGKTSKEIADVLQISVSGVDFHRKMLRKKLGLANSGQNLRSYLLSLN